MSRLPIPIEQYEFRFSQVLDFIDNHLSEDLNLDRLAELAHFSRYHFLRVFQELHNETPHAYIRRRRLERGASCLLYTSQAIAVVASECGFDSTDGFARAFRQYFGVTPILWRQQQQLAMTPQQVPLVAPGERLRPVHIVQLSPTRVAYTRHVGPYGEASLAQWSQLTSWIREHDLPQLMRFGMGLDDPLHTPQEKCRYDVCVELPEQFVPPARTPVKIIAGGPCAILRFDGPPDRSGQAWHRLLREALADRRYKLSEQPCFERYTPTMADPSADAQCCDICLPLQLRAAL